MKFNYRILTHNGTHPVFHYLSPMLVKVQAKSAKEAITKAKSITGRLNGMVVGINE